MIWTSISFNCNSQDRKIFRLFSNVFEHQLARRTLNFIVTPGNPSWVCIWGILWVKLSSLEEYLVVVI